MNAEIDDLEYYSTEEDPSLSDKESSSSSSSSSNSSALAQNHSLRCRRLDKVCRYDTLTLCVPVKLDVYRTEITFFVDCLVRDSLRTNQFVSKYLDATPREYAVWILRDCVLDFPRALGVYHFEKQHCSQNQNEKRVRVIDEWFCDGSCEFEQQAKVRFDKATKVL